MLVNFFVKQQLCHTVLSSAGQSYLLQSWCYTTGVQHALAIFAPAFVCALLLEGHVYEPLPPWSGLHQLTGTTPAVGSSDRARTDSTVHAHDRLVCPYGLQCHGRLTHPLRLLNVAG